MEEIFDLLNSNTMLRPLSFWNAETLLKLQAPWIFDVIRIEMPALPVLAYCPRRAKRTGTTVKLSHDCRIDCSSYNRRMKHQSDAPHTGNGERRDRR